ncbi:MAG: hypothetical protein IPN94_14925 [Sphingobacteriales bacterium]|nr:hypothetical protein [Sphingobacteriales bacterium]
MELTIEERKSITISPTTKPTHQPHHQTSTNVAMGSTLKTKWYQPTSTIPPTKTYLICAVNYDFRVELRIKYNANNATGDAAFIGNKNWDKVGLNKGFVTSTPTDELPDKR